MTAPWETAPQGKAAAMAASVAGNIPMLTTARLTLRAPRMVDFDMFAALFAAPEARHLGGTLDRAGAMEVFLSITGGWQLRGHGLWSVDLTATGQHLGFVLLDHEAGDPEAELGYLFPPQSRGHGYATEAATAARDFARDVLGWSSLVSYIDPDNTRSAALAQRLGAVADEALFDGARVYRYVLGRPDQTTDLRKTCEETR